MRGEGPLRVDGRSLRTSAAGLQLREAGLEGGDAAEFVAALFRRFARLLQLLRDEDRADLNTAGALIENEPAMAASVLRMANSASFGGLRRLEDPGEAIGRLGLRQVSSLVTAVSHRGHFESGDPERKQSLRVLWDHAVATALASKSLAAREGADLAESFLAGLLHDIGKLLVLKGADQEEMVRVIAR